MIRLNDKEQEYYTKLQELCSTYNIYPEGFDTGNCDFRNPHHVDNDVNCVRYDHNQKCWVGYKL